MIQIFDISDNQFNGSLPNQYFKNFKVMIGAIKLYSWPHTYEESVIIIILKGQELYYKRILKILTTIYLSNMFQANISYSIGMLNLLRYLNLSHNILKAHIPAHIVDITALESLDLSSNQLAGKFLSS